MKYINEEGCLIIKSWCNSPEGGAIEQAKNMARLPFAFRQICLMPDTHQGYGMPIGGVLAARGAVIPNAVGVDIGCGMCAVRTSLISIDTETLETIMGKIREAVPVGFNHHKEPQDESLMPEDPITGGFGYVVHHEYGSALHQLGTLGGGNHFIEIQQCRADGHVWIMIHSGSRNLGKKVADHYNKTAVELNAKWLSSVPKSADLAFLPTGTTEYNLYMHEMQYCVDFALANRGLMIQRIEDIFKDVTRCDFEPYLNIAHNYARWENHFGENVIVHRKGATSARAGEIGIIPGSQGTSSYIVEGLGNPESFMSCSHGAGRKMGRKEAQRTLNLADEQKKLDDRGILHAIRGEQDLDEASGAYKDIDVVMDEQSDLVRVLYKLEPLGVIKG